MQPLPIDSLLPEIVASLRGRAPNLVIEAPPWAGKTTRVPVALLDAGLAGDGEVWVLEPRRLAARLAARRVAEERGERVGDSVGYQVRFDEVSGPSTRLRFVAMSATLEAAPIAEYLSDCPTLRSEGRRFEVAVEHLSRADERPLAAQVEGAVRRLLTDGLDGDVLVFLPGAAEIRRAQEACAPFAEQSGWLVLPLHGELPAAEQDRAVKPSEQRKIILSTNVAESSITIESVLAVVDSGLARIAGHSPWSGIATLNVARISKAAAMQRAGRAGRTRPGRCLRLYTAQDFAARPEHETPEIQRLDLTEPVLELHAAGIRDLHGFNWFEAPTRHALDAAESLLRRLGALDAEARVTKTGERMLRFPLHPRLARMLVEA